MDDCILTETYKGYAFQIIPDTDPLNPREDYDNAATMICFHRKYTLGDQHNYTSPLASVNDVIQEIAPNHEDMHDLDEATVELDTLPVFTLPLYLYDHSGITMNTTGFSCTFDSGQVGFIYMTYAKAMSEQLISSMTPTDDEKTKVFDILRAEVKVYDQYLTGDVYGYIVYDGAATDEDGDENEQLYSCWGLFGEDVAIEAAKEFIDGTIQP